MNIEILHMIEGAKQAKGIAVIIDVFRAFSFECYAMNNNASKIIPVADTNIAYKLKDKNPDFVLAGERNGKILEGFDFGNSPSQIENVDFTDKVIIHTTSAGTQGFINAKNATEKITGSLVNAKAIAQYIKESGYQDISLVCMGLRAETQTEEDNLCAEYIKALLEGKIFNIEEEIEKLKTTAGKKFFDKEQKDVFPEKDFFLCTDINKFNFILKVEQDDLGLDYIKKIPVSI